MFRLPLMLYTLVLPTSLAAIPATNPAPKNGEALVAMMLYFVRSLEPSKKDPSVTSETRFDKYIPLAGGVARMEVLFLVNGAPQVKEEYTDPKVNPKLDRALCDPKSWKPAGWIRTQPR